MAGFSFLQKRRFVMQLNDVQLYVISIMAMALIYVIALIAKRFNWYPQRGWLTAFLYVLAAGLAFVWSAFTLPPFPAFADPLTFVAGLFAYLNILLTELGPVVALATLIYNVLGKRVLEGIEARIVASTTATKKAAKK
jgi:hypothetical protein